MSEQKERIARTNGSPHRPLRIHGSIARNLGVSIVSGRYKPGDLLEGEVASSEQLHVSRTAYREAVRILAAKGLVESRPKVGTRVSPQDQWHLLDPDVLSWIFEGEPDEAILRNLFELRFIVEPAAAALAAERRTPAQLKALRQALDDMARHTLKVEAGRLADQEFHKVLLRATANPFIVSLTDSVASAINNTTIFKQRDAPLQRDPLPDHDKVYEAVANRDASAAQDAMTELIRLALYDTPVAHWTSGGKTRPSRRARASAGLRKRNA